MPGMSITIGIHGEIERCVRSFGFQSGTGVYGTRGTRHFSGLGG
jgi:hypothetical protein